MKKNEFTQELKKPSFWGYVLALIVLVTIFNLSEESKTVNVVSLILLVVVQWIYGINQKKQPYNKTLYQKWVGIIYALSLSAFAIINVSLKVDEPNVAISLFLLYSGFIMLGFTLVTFRFLWKSETLKGILFFYILFSLSINYFFAFGYSVASGFEGNSIVDLQGASISGSSEYLYFSYSNFYTSVVENIPQGVSKVISIIQIMISYILHIILLGVIIQKNLLKK